MVLFGPDERRLPHAGPGLRRPDLLPFVPRFTPDGELNPLHLQRLKDKLGNRSNASAEVEFDGAWARMVGEEGEGVPTIIEMVNRHQASTAWLGGAAGMRQGSTVVAHHAAHRSAFGERLADHPSCRTCSPTSTSSPRPPLPSSWPGGGAPSRPTPRRTAFKRIAAVAKYWVGKRGPQ